MMLITKEYHSARYRMFEIHEKGKVRDVADVPFFPDRIVHWAVILVLKDYLNNNLIPQTYSALPNRGAHKALKIMKQYLEHDDAKYYLKLDIRKYFPSIDKDILMRKLRKRIKDEDYLQLCEVIIYEFPYSGLPIGNYCSQYWANFYLSELDHYLKEAYHCKYYLRYMDDIVIIGWSKAWLRRCLGKIRDHIETIGLHIKDNWTIRPVSEGIDFVGFVTYKKNDRVYVLLRKRTKVRLKRACRRMQCKLSNGEPLNDHDKGVLASYYGCIQWCNGHHLGIRTVYAVMIASGISFKSATAIDECADSAHTSRPYGD